MLWRIVPVIVAAGLVLGYGETSAQPPSAFGILEQVRKAYADLDAYNDLGEIETTSGIGGSEQTKLRFFETTATAAGELLWRCHGEAETGFEERAVWRNSEGSFVYTSLYNQFKLVPSLVAELANAIGRGGYDTLVVPLLLAGASDALADPTAAVVEGSEACGDARCWVVSLTRMAGAAESELRIDQQTMMIHEVVVRLGNEQALLEPADPAHRSGPMTIRVRHQQSQETPPSYEPPADARRVVKWEPSSATAESPAEDPWTGLGFAEEITVSLLQVVARIVDTRGEPLLNLRSDDLIVRVGETEIPVRNLEWSSSSQPLAIPPIELAETQAAAGAVTSGDDAKSPADGGKLVVLFLQVNFEPSRIAGHLKILPDVEKLLNTLHPDDRVAILSFDFHLKLWLDFTRDRATAFQVLKQAISYGEPPAHRSRDLRRSQSLSLAEYFDYRAAADAASPEKALQLTAEALAPLPGEKDLIYLGWGLGRFGSGGVRMTADYRPAVRALDAARATVFVLDVSQADYHSLEVGLQNVAAHTGGTYARTLHFASQAVDRLARTIGGHYLVTIERTNPMVRGRLSIGLRQQKGRVIFKPLILG